MTVPIVLKPCAGELIHTQPPKMLHNQMNEALWQQVEDEMLRAYEFRAAGNEGKARVCARRAAGKALVASGVSPSASLEAIRNFQKTSLFPPPLASAFSNLLMSVNESHQLDVGIDLLADATVLIRFLRSK
jgi:hypothetical protein